MNRKVSILMLIVLLAGTSCKKDRQEYMFVETFPEQVELTGEVLPLDDILLPMLTYEIGPYIVVTEARNDCSLHIYDGESYEKRLSLINKGRGPMEAPTGLVTLSCVTEKPGNNTVWVTAGHSFLGLLNIDRSVESGKPVFDQFYDFRQDDMIGYFPRMNIAQVLPGPVLLSFSLYDPDIEDVNPYVVKFDYNTRKFFDPTFLSSYDFSQSDEMVRFLIGADYKPDHTKVAGAFTYMDRVHIADLETKAIKVIGFTEKPGKSVPASPEAVYNDGLCVSDDYIFVFYLDERVNGKNSIIRVLDWEGNPVRLIKLDHPVGNPKISGDYLYAAHPLEHYVIRYKIT